MGWCQYDPSQRAQLVDLANHDAYEADISEALGEATTSGDPLALLVLDVDHFKNVNDTHGHAAGDNVLKAVANAMRSIVGTRGKCYRYGGEEMVALLPQFSQLEALAVAERVRDKVSRIEGDVRVTASIGVSTSEMLPHTDLSLFNQADAAMYRAKKGGRNRVVAFSIGEQEQRPGPLILIVDHEKFIRNVAADFLGLEGYRTLPLASVAELLPLEEKPDLILVSIEMPEMNGAKLVQTLVGWSGGKPVLGMTGNPNAELVIECYRSGITDMVLKPFKVEGLVAMCKKYAELPPRKPAPKVDAARFEQILTELLARAAAP